MRAISLAPRAADECMRRSCSPTVLSGSPFVSVSDCLSVRPSVYMSVCPSVYLFVRRSVRLFVSYDGNNNRNYYSYNIVLYYYKKNFFSNENVKHKMDLVQSATASTRSGGASPLFMAGHR